MGWCPVQQIAERTVARAPDYCKDTLRRKGSPDGDCNDGRKCVTLTGSVSSSGVLVQLSLHITQADKLLLLNY